MLRNRNKFKLDSVMPGDRAWGRKMPLQDTQSEIGVMLLTQAYPELARIAARLMSNAGRSTRGHRG